MTSIVSRLWDFGRRHITQPVPGTTGRHAVGRAAIPPPPDDTDPDTIRLPWARAQSNRPRGYQGMRRDIKARNRQAGPHRRGHGSEVAL